MLFANRAALELTGEESPVGRPVTEWIPAGLCRDAEGRPLTDDALPSVRAARGERVRGTMVTCPTTRGERTLRATAQAVTAPDGAPAVLVTFEDVTELRAAQLGERLVADDLRAILEGVADSITAQGPDGSLVYANEAAVRVLGFPSAGGAARGAARGDHVALGAAHARGRRRSRWPSCPGRLALMGEEPEDVLVQFIDRETDETRWSRIKAKPVRDADGSVRLAINVIEDVTELKQVEQSQRFLAEASRALADSLEYESTLASIAHLAVPVVADWCAVDLVADVAGELDRVAVAHVDPDKVIWAQEIAERYPADPRGDRGVHHVLRTGESQVWADIPDALIVEAAQDEEHLRLIRTLGMTSAMMVPMRVRDRVLRRDLVRQRGVGAALQRRRPAARGGPRAARRHRRRERPPLPRPHHDRPHAAGVAAAAGAARGARHRGRRAVPARRRGARGRRRLLRPLRDGEDHWFAVIGDVCGKGAEAAAITALARYTIRAAAAQRRSPAAILSWVNEAMLREGSSRFCTIAVAHLDRSGPTTRLTVAVGGHPAPLVLRADGSRRGGRRGRDADRPGRGPEPPRGDDRARRR